ncbi:unnamed protein product [Camellia sinensis]
MISCYVAFEAVLQLFLPGKRVEGPISPAGNRPVYKVPDICANGVAAYAVTLITYLSLWWFGVFNPTIVYDHLGEIFSALIFGSFIVCIFFYIKGHVAPSSSDSGSCGNIIIDFYWGMELYPRIGKKFDIKVFTNCRFGMIGIGESQDSVLVSISKKGRFEMNSFYKALMRDRRMTFPQTAISTGILCIYINYDCSRQRQEFRRTNGKCLVWGKSFIKIAASYTAKGETKTSLLLTSGWWNMSACENVVGGKLMLKGKALDVKAGGVKKKKKQKKHYDEISQVNENELSAGGNTGMATDLNQDDVNDANKSAGEGNSASYDEHLTPAERCYMEQKEQIDVHRLAKISNKSHRDRIQDFNWYLANMSEHYDIPKVGPG